MESLGVQIRFDADSVREYNNFDFHGDTGVPVKIRDNIGYLVKVINQIVFVNKQDIREII